MEQDHSEFNKTIESIKLAESNYDNIIAKAKEEAQRKIHESKEIVQMEKKKNSDEILKMKNEMLKKGSKTIEDDVDKIINKAKENSLKIKSGKVDSVFVDKLIEEFLNSV